MLGIASALTASFAQAAGRASSKVEITDYTIAEGKAIFEGKVKSPAAKCDGRGRKVKLVGYDEGGPKRSFGSDRTNANGRWKVREPIPFFEDFVFAKVKRTSDCKGDRSEPMSTAG